MLTPVPMVKAEVLVHRDYIDSVLYSLGIRGIVEIDDIRVRLEHDKELKAHAKPVEPSTLLFQLSSISSRVTTLITALGISESVQPEEISDQALDEAALKKMSAFLDQIQEWVSSLQPKIAELEQSKEKSPEAEQQLSAMLLELRKLGQNYGQKLVTCRALVEPRLGLENAKTRMARTEATIVFQGWLKKEDVKTFRQLVEKESDGNCFVSLSTPRVGHGGHERETRGLGERPPTLLSNPRVARVYQKLVTGFGVPNYFELDPSILWFFTFPIIFGLMFGDLGQGAVLATLAFVGFLLKSKGAKGGELTMYILEGTPLFVMCGVAASFAGFFYGDFFGFHLSAHEGGVYLPGVVEAREGLLEFLDDLLGPLKLYFPPDFTPLKYPTVLLKIAIYIAVIHMSLGLVLSLINKLRSREFTEAFAGPVTWLWLYSGGAYLFATYGGGVFSALFSNMELSLIFIALPFVVMLVARMKTAGVDGFGEALDSLISSLSNTISYARIFAFAMIHVVLSGLFISLGHGLGVPAIGALLGTFFFVFFEVVFVFFQALRLHWVEFGLKFYGGDGVDFEPFSTRASP